jgi:4-coumarate--CoA ligase
LGQALLYNFDRNPNGVAQLCDHNGHELTYKQLKSQCIRVTENLRKLGYNAGDMVTTMARNGQALAPLVLGCFMLGTPLNPLDATYQVDDIAHMFGITQPKAVFCDHDFVEKIEAALKITGHKCEIFTFEQRVADYRFVEELFEDVGIDESDYR